MIIKVESYSIPGHTVGVYQDDKEFGVTWNYCLVLKPTLEEALSLFNKTINMVNMFNSWSE